MRPSARSRGSPSHSHCLLARFLCLLVTPPLLPFDGRSVITSDAEAVQHIHASREHPRFLIENAHTGHEALVSEPSIRAVLMPLPEKKK